MILDSLRSLDRYRNLSANMEQAVRFLQTADLTALPPGRVEISGDDVYANHFSYVTVPFSKELQFEAHRKYLDLHVPLSGCERIALAPVENLAETKALEEEDAVLYQGEAKDYLTLESGSFLLLYPEEGHLPKLISKAATNVDKLVVKIAL